MKKMMAVTSKDKIVSYFLTERHASSPDVNKISLLVTLMVFLHFNAKEKVKITNAIKNVNDIPSRHERKSLFNQRRKKKEHELIIFLTRNTFLHTYNLCNRKRNLTHMQWLKKKLLKLSIWNKNVMRIAKALFKMKMWLRHVFQSLKADNCHQNRSFLMQLGWHLYHILNLCWFNTCRVRKFFLKVNITSKIPNSPPLENAHFREFTMK